MATRLKCTTGWSLLILAGCLVARGSEPPGDKTLAWSAFSEPALLHRFDRNLDGQLNAAERTNLRKSFGGLDVPMLSEKSNRYTLDDESLQHLAARLRLLDNTPEDNPITDEGATLGRVLFYDKMLSANNTIACASCHLQERAFADPRRFSVGFHGGQTARNAMALANLRFTMLRGSRPGFFWDERAATLEDQVLMPIQDKIEMGMQLKDLETKLQRLPYYPPLFEVAFGSQRVTSERVAKAISQFMRSMVSFDAKFDRAAKAAGDGDYARDFTAFSVAENRGKSLFIKGVDEIAEIGCAHCHVPPTFGMPKSFNNGLALHYADQGLGARDVPSNDPFTATNDGKFKASSLRNIALTAPYMHDGRFATLDQVVDHYSSGVHQHANLGLALNEPASDDATETATSGFGLTRQQQAALVAFLKTLTDESFIADPRFSDPFVRQ